VPPPNWARGSVAARAVEPVDCKATAIRLAILGLGKEIALKKSKTAAIAITLLTVLASVATPAAAHPGVPSSLYDPNSATWGSYRDYFASDFNAIVAEQRAAGRMLVDIDKDLSAVSGSLPRYAGVFQRNLDGRDWYTVDEVQHSRIRDVIEDNRAAGMRLVDLEPYLVNGLLTWASLWVENVEGYSWDVVVAVPVQQLSQFADSERAAGRMLIDIDMHKTHRTNQCCLGSAVSVRNAENLAWTPIVNHTSDEFGAVFDVLLPTNRILVADSATSPTGQRFSAVWVENRNGRGRFFYRGMTVDQWGARWQELADAGYRVINFERYETPDGIRYLGAWRQNN
jgi:hypothetical protein